MPGLDILWSVLNALVSFGVITVLFALMFKVLPDVIIALRDVWVGAVTTSILFTAGKSLLGLYLGSNSSVTAYGASAGPCEFSGS
jgi:membrane protein